MVGEELFSANPTALLSSSLGISNNFAIAIIFIITIWSLAWKGFALWKSAMKKNKVWFVILLIVNTIGILEILYIYVFSEMNFNKKYNKIKKK